MHTEVLQENLKGEDHFRDIGMCERMILKWMVEKL
jgi:hypothetical protein